MSNNKNQSVNVKSAQQNHSILKQSTRQKGPPHADSSAISSKNGYVPTKPTWAEVLPPSYLIQDSIELMEVTATHEQQQPNVNQKKKRDTKGMAKQHDDFIEQLYSTHRLYSQMQQHLIPQSPEKDQELNAPESPQQLINVAPLSDQANNQPNVKKDDSSEGDLLQFHKKENGNSTSQHEVRKPDPKFLLYAVAGCVFFASGGVIRKFQGNNVFIANAMITLSFLFTGLVYFIISAIKAKTRKIDDNGSSKDTALKRKYLFPWQTLEETRFGLVINTKKRIFAWVFIGGALEYLGAQASTIAFNCALAAGMNGGIVGALVALNTVFVIIMAYYMFKESFGKIKLLSVLLLISSVVLVTLFPPENITSKDDMLITGASGAGSIQISNRLTEDEFFFNKILMIGGGLVASVSFGSQLLVFKHISFSTKDTFGIGFGFLFSCGILGLISLVIQSLRDFETILDLPLIEMIGPLAIGQFTALGIVLANIGAGIGIAGISNSIIHSSIVIVTTFNYFIFNQPLSLLQVLGISLTFFGCILLAFEDKIIGRRAKKSGSGKITNPVNGAPIW